ncbi:tetratricopeptide repeat protein [Psychrobacillus sp. OK032]|uniref:tetratricopeptide repeat protein n=1 Tax=Psychrobacillus sp. OK032 TaxID=1884358 RepID=UPI0008CDA5C9|nr:tetratricopeptide repeat protein [Psychrobacillus sp. OK032]SES18611.1 hypothetical protein SAMN05518872_105193 [Psychrobacillus sp. OK032]
MKTHTFFGIQKKVFNAFERSEFDEVLKLIDEAEIELPKRREKYCFWRACAFARMGEKEKAISVLQEALSLDVWWNPNTLMRDKDLSSLHEEDEFQLIIQRCQSILETQELKEALFVPFGNEHAKTGIFSIHWRGSNIEDFAPFWLEENDYLIGFPQSSQSYASNSYCWDNHEKAIAEVKDSVEKFYEQYEFDNFIVAGTSQGGKLSIELALDKKYTNVKGFIAVIPAIENITTFESLIVNANKPNLKGCIITGDQDPFYEKTMELVEIFKQNGIECSIFVTEGLGHFFPDNFSQQLKKAVDFINKGEFNGNQV